MEPINQNYFSRSHHEATMKDDYKASIFECHTAKSTKYQGLHHQQNLLTLSGVANSTVIHQFENMYLLAMIHKIPRFQKPLLATSRSKSE